MKTAVYNKEGKEVSSMEISDEWNEIPLHKQTIKDAVTSYLAGKRRGTAKAKNRSEINFTTRKPWKQKGTGRARAGTASSPIWRKGGVVFGPVPRDFSIRLPKRIKRLALKSILGDKVRNKEVILIDKIKSDTPKTKDATALLNNVKAGRKPLIVVKDLNRNVWLSFRNVTGADVYRASDLNSYLVIAHNKLIFEKEAWEEIEEKCLSQENPKQE